MEKAFHIQRVAAKMKATERSIDEAMTLAAELMIEMKSAQDGLELGPIVGDSAYAKLSQAMAELAQARSSFITTHKRLVKIYDICDLRTVASTTIPTSNFVRDERVEEIDDLAVAG
jgi:hypothetical protein